MAGRRLFPLAVLVLILLGAAPASAAPPWLRSELVRREPAVFGSSLQIAVDSTGEAVAVWNFDRFPKEHPDREDTIVMSAWRPPGGGAWSAPETLIAPDHASFIGEPSVAIEDGEAVVAWERYGRHGFVIEARSRPRGGVWSGPSILSKGGHEPLSPLVAVDGAGEAIVLWENFTRKSVLLESAARPAGGAWSDPITVSVKRRNVQPTQGNQEARLVVNASGEAVAAWEWRTHGGWGRIESASRSPSGTWSAPVALSHLAASSSPQVAINAAGESVAIWSGAGDIESAGRMPDGTWSPAVAIAQDGTEGAAEAVQVVISSRGEGVAVWKRCCNGVSVALESAVRSPEGTWSKPTLIARTHDTFLDAEVAANAAGETVAAWTVLPILRHPGRPMIEGAYRSPGGDWSAPVAITNRRVEEPRIGIDAAGEATAAWLRFARKALYVESAARPPGR